VAAVIVDVPVGVKLKSLWLKCRNHGAQAVRKPMMGFDVLYAKNSIKL